MAPVKTTDIQLLKHLGLRGCINEYISLSSSDLARDMSMSQQTASNRILHLLEQGLIEPEALEETLDKHWRRDLPLGQVLTDTGRLEQSQLDTILSRQRAVTQIKS